MAMKTKANNIQFDYDEQADVLHVSFGTGEPSFSEEFDDLLLRQPVTGVQFRIDALKALGVCLGTK